MSGEVGHPASLRPLPLPPALSSITNRQRFRQAVYFHLGGLDLTPDAACFHTQPRSARLGGAEVIRRIAAAYLRRRMEAE